MGGQKRKILCNLVQQRALLIDKADDKVLVSAFTNGLQFEEFLFSIYKNDL